MMEVRIARSRNLRAFGSSDDPPPPVPPCIGTCGLFLAVGNGDPDDGDPDRSI